MNADVAPLCYDRLGYVALNVTDVGRSARFYEQIVGLQPAGAGPAGEVLFRCSAAHHEIMLSEGSEPGLKRLGWIMAGEAAFDFARVRLEHLGLAVSDVAPQEARALGLTAAYRFREPTTGALFEFGWGAASAAQPFRQTHTAIARLGHVVLTSPDRPATEAFLREQLNFRVSDRITDTVTFMRCFPNPYHHSLGVGQGGARAALNHVNFMVTQIDDIGRAINRMKKHGVKVVYGPGRHPPSESVFFYFLDPDGLTLEYSFGMEEFAPSGAREPRELPRSLESIDYWGGTPEPQFGAIGAIEK